MRGAQAWRLGPGDAGERPFSAPVAELAYCDLVRLQVQELEIAEPGRELTRQVAGVFLTALEHDTRTGVGCECLAPRRLRLPLREPPVKQRPSSTDKPLPPRRCEDRKSRTSR